MNTDFMWEKVVGQESARKQITHYHVNRFQRDRTFPNVLLVGQKGGGKSHLARAIGRGLFQIDTDGRPCLKSDGKTPLPRKFIEINASTIKSISQFINSVLIPHVIDREVSIFVDEASEIPHKVAMAMLTMLEPNATNKTTFVDVDSDMIIDLDFSRQCFLFATTDAQKLFPPLVDRLKRINIEDYSNSQLGEIMRRVCSEVEFEDGILLDVATTVRGNARQAVERAKDIQDMVTARGYFGVRQWNALKKALSILPLAVSPIELSLMRICAEHPEGVTLTGLAARSGLSNQSIQRDHETYLMRQNLITVTAGKGRCLTSKGQIYLKELEKAI